MRLIKKMTLVLFSLTLVYCGDGDRKKSDSQVKLKNNPGTSSAASANDSDATEVILLATDQMKFNMSEIRVPAGKPVRLTLRHTGTMDRKVMGHNFVLLTQGTEIPAFAKEATEFADNEYIPEDTDQVIAYTDLLGGGESDTIEFEAPEPGTYNFLCSFPGHYALMKGTFVVE